MVKETIKHLEEWANPRTVVVLTLLLLGALWSVLIAAVVSARHASIASTGELLQRLTHAVEEETRQQFRVADTFLASCALWLQANPDRDPRSDPAFRRLIESFRARTGASINIYLLAAGGQMFDVLNKVKGPVANVADREYFKNALDSTDLLVGSPAPKPVTGDHGLPITLPLHRPVHGIRALLAMIDLPTLTRSYEEQRQEPGGAITLLRRDGTVLARAPVDQPLLGDSIAGEPLFSEHLAQQAKVFVTPDDSADSEAREFISYSSMPDFPLVIMVSEGYDAALAPWLRQTALVVLLAIGVTVPLTVVAYRSLRLLQLLANRDAQLQQLAATDRLTGSSSRQHFVAILEEQLARAQRRQLPLTVLLFDIDFFQRINDGYGHAVGDQALIAFATVAKECLREIGVLGRLGASEFAILLPDTDLEEGVLIAERTRSRIAEISIPTENGTVQFTASVGVSEARATDSSVDDLLKRVGMALHDAKARGHDRTAVV